MANYQDQIAGLVAGCVDALDAETVAGMLEVPPNPEMGDFSLPCFKLSKTLRKAPPAIAEEIRQALPAHPSVARTVALNGYLNFFLDKRQLAQDVVATVLAEGGGYGSSDAGHGRTVVIDFSSPNIAKPFHIGHLRSTVIGNALYKMHAFLGYRSVGINHLGDWGTQFGKMIVAYRKWGSETEVREGGVAELLRLYVLFHDEAEKEPALEDEARATFADLEKGDPEAVRLWQWFKDISLQEFNRIYELLGVRFDSDAGESFYNDKMAPVVAELREKGLLEEDDGAQIVRLDDYNMPPALIVKKDGASLYHTRDIAAAMYRKMTYDFAKCIYVTDYAQNLHFQQWFKIIELMGHAWASDLVHVAFGRVSLEGAGLSTRKGNVVKLEELLTKAIERTREIIEQKNPQLPDKEAVARQVGVGAIIFNDLSANRIKDVNFSWDTVLNFEGETGPYVQYTHARTCSLLRKAGVGEIAAVPAAFDAARLTDKEAQAVLMELYRFPAKVREAAEKLEPSMISRYLVDLAQAFNRFYHEHAIVVDDAAVRTARLALVQCVRTTLATGLGLLGIAAPKQI